MNTKVLLSGLVTRTVILLLVTMGWNAHALTLTLNPNADTEAAADRPTTNFGYNGTLRIDTKRIAYLRFDLGSLYGATVNNARLSLYPVNSAPAKQSAQQMAATAWNESTLTWKNRPTKIDATLAVFGPTSTGSWVTLDVTRGVKAYTGRSLTISISGTNSSTLYLNSREAAQNRPTLVVDYTPPTHSTPSAAFGVGINLAAPAYWGAELAFTDLMKLSGGWYTQCDPYNSPPDPICSPGSFPRVGASAWDTLEEDCLVTDADGWPITLSPDSVRCPGPVAYTRVAALVPAGLSPMHPSGRVIVTYSGSGTIRYAFNGSKDEAASNPGRDVLNVQSEPGAETSSMIQVILTAIDPLNPLTNIRVIPEIGSCSNDVTLECDPQNPGTRCSAGVCQSLEMAANTQPFHPRFLANLKPFGLIRTMEFQNTNDTTLSDWTKRTRLSSVRWTARDNSDGAPLEVIAQLANTLESDLWLNVSSRATDDLVTQMASLMKTQLRPERRIILEYANEAWNTAFSAGSWMENQGVTAWPIATDSDYVKRLNWYAKRSVEICQKWKSAWGAVDSNRVTCVAGGQSASAYYAGIVLDCALYAATRGGRPCYADLDGLAVAPYFGHYLGSSDIPAGAADSNSNIVAGWTLDVLFQELTEGTGLLNHAPSGGALQGSITELQSQIATARDRGLNLYGYEAGQHLVGVWGAVDDNALTALFTSANRDLRMGDLYRQYLANWQVSGAGPVMLYNSVASYGKWGSWGLLEWRDQSVDSPPNTAQKYKAVVQDFLGRPLPQ